MSKRLLTTMRGRRRRVVVGAEGAPHNKENIMNHVTRRLIAGVVTATAGSLAAAAALTSPAQAAIIVHDVGGEPTIGTATDQQAGAADFPLGPYAADNPPGPYVRSSIIPCL
jgi:hypothetical protein